MGRPSSHSGAGDERPGSGLVPVRLRGRHRGGLSFGLAAFSSRKASASASSVADDIDDVASTTVQSARYSPSAITPSHYTVTPTSELARLRLFMPSLSSRAVNGLVGEPFTLPAQRSVLFPQFKQLRHHPEGPTPPRHR
jgi:hypothetical protein